MFLRAVSILERTRGPEDGDLATYLHQLARMCQAQGKHAKADPLLRRVLAIWEKSLGPQAPGVAMALNNLDSALLAQNKAAEAEPLLRRALAITADAFGSGHEHVATVTVGHEPDPSVMFLLSSTLA